MSFAAALAARRGYFLLSLAVLVSDQVTKLLAHRFLSDRVAVPIIPDFFSLWYSRNPGGLFGTFRDWNSPGRFLLLTVLPMVAIVFITVFLTRTSASDRATLFGLSLILGGAIGNLIDRLVRGEVIDFLDVYIKPSRLADWLVERFGTSHWPTFNIADSAIIVGACLLLLSIVRPPKGAEIDEPDGPSTRADLNESM